MAVSPGWAADRLRHNDCTVRVWDVADGRELASWVTDAAEIHCCAVSPCDPTIVVYGG